jgi:hypothetical protein
MGKPLKNGVLGERELGVPHEIGVNGNGVNGREPNGEEENSGVPNVE